MTAPITPFFEWIIQDAGQFACMEMAVWTDRDGSRFNGPANIPAFSKWHADRSGYRDHESLGYLLAWEWFDDSRNTPPIGVVRAYFDGHRLVGAEGALGSIAERNLRLHRRLSALVAKLNENLDNDYGPIAYVRQQILGLWAAAHALRGQYAPYRRNAHFQEALDCAQQLWLTPGTGWSALGGFMFPGNYLAETVRPAVRGAVDDVACALQADGIRKSLEEQKEIIRGQAQTSGSAAADDKKKLYVMRQGNSVKIGISVAPRRRAKDLNTGPDGSAIELLAYRDVADARAAEKILHNRLGRHRVRNEWFAANAEVEREVRKFIPDARFAQEPAQTVARDSGAEGGGVSDLEIAKFRRFHRWPR